MRRRQLRFLRIGVSLLFFGTTSLLFLDVAGIVQPGASHGVLYPQFTPSLIRLLQGSLLAASSLVLLGVACLDCIAACNESAIGYHRAGRAPAVRVAQPSRMSFPKALQEDLRATVVDSARRSFVGLSAGGLAGIGAGGIPADLDACTRAKAAGVVPTAGRTPVVAPGSQGIEHLRSACIACQLCVSSCPTRVLQPSLLELGAQSLLQPHLDFRVAFCDYECTRCGDVCPTQAIVGLTAEVKKRTKIGEVCLVEENCIAIVEKKTCAACAEYCPTRAVHLVPDEDGGIRPKLDTPVCIGCGACEYACPAQPQKAIFVEGAQEHRKARPPRNFPMHHYRYPDGFPF